ncbi:MULTISPECIES: hypothetical protein [Actinoalloteichus]|uniref:Uncharacterized protein n=1 Tax=Actinoalloteichus fjordicus TaxID=1612552 RepID=A0AAC9L9A2_9PSEU|nr:MULTISPECIES: hypothetical protein [Actinoalloteichus]APU13467.1 hypothetical protein UA74_06990 [Actinoalloteichus fjordicus]APU19416.1 hypothetical protein UA75_06985 [Actinoalloteichus sp. GBA129-24]
MLCRVADLVTVRSWLLLPPLFLATVVGLAGAICAVAGTDVALSSPILFGSAAAIAMVTSVDVDWHGIRALRWAGWAYVGVLLLPALMIDGIELPVPIALAIGLVGAGCWGAFRVGCR